MAWRPNPPWDRRRKPPRPPANSAARRHWFSQPLPFGHLEDCGISDYREFACSHETLEWLLGGAMTHVDGEPVTLVVAERCAGGNVIVKAWTKSAYAHADGKYAWQVVA